MTDPCKYCPTRKTLAKIFDIHVWGEDCPYVCEEYDEWKAAQKAKEEGHDRPGQGDKRA